MSATAMPLYIEQGATKTFGFVWSNEDPLLPGNPGDVIDLTGCTAHMQIRKRQGDPVLIDVSSTGENPGITLGGETGQVLVKLTAAQTTLLTARNALYDMEITMPNGDVHRAVEGSIEVSPNITQQSEEPVVTD